MPMRANAQQSTCYFMCIIFRALQYLIKERRTFEERSHFSTCAFQRHSAEILIWKKSKLLVCESNTEV